MKIRVRTDQLKGIEINQVIDYEDATPMVQYLVDNDYPCFDRIKEPSIEMGQYWKSKYSDTVYRVNGVSSDHVSYGDISEQDEAHDMLRSHTYWMSNMHELSDHEAKEALLEEAKRRGYAPYNFSCLVLHTVPTGSGYEFSSEGDLYLGGNAVYLRATGEWAEFRGNEWDAFQDDDGIYVTNGAIEVRDDTAPSEKGLTEEQATAIADALNGLNNEGS